MLNCVIYIAIVILILILFYYYVRLINRETNEEETEGTKIIAGEFTNNIKNLQSDVIKKYLYDIQIKSKLDVIEQQYKDIEKRIILIEDKFITDNNIDEATVTEIVD